VPFRNKIKVYLRGGINDLGNGIENGIVDASFGLLWRALPTTFRVIVTIDRINIRFAIFS